MVLFDVKPFCLDLWAAQGITYKNSKAIYVQTTHIRIIIFSESVVFYYQYLIVIKCVLDDFC